MLQRAQMASCGQSLIQSEVLLIVSHLIVTDIGDRSTPSCGDLLQIAQIELRTVFIVDEG